MVKVTSETIKRMTIELAGINWVDDKQCEWLASQLQKFLEAIDKIVKPELRDVGPATIYKVRSKDE